MEDEKMKEMIENTKAQMRKGILELCTLSIIAEQEQAYSSDIIQQLRDSDMIVKEGTLYPLLSRLKKSGILHYKWEESETGPPRKYYFLTEPGQDFLNGLHDTWKRLVYTVHNSTKNISN